MKTHLTDQQRRAFIDAAEAMAALIREHTLHGMYHGLPSGELYASVMHAMSFDTYQTFILYLINQGIIKKLNSHLLVYIRNDQPFPETDDAIAMAKRVIARVALKQPGGCRSPWPQAEL